MTLFWISVGVFAAGLLVLLSKRLTRHFNKNFPTPRKNAPHFAVLIPARDESAVISELLDSLAGQVNPKDVFVIVETEDDPTVRLARERKMQVFVRGENCKQRKGFALDEIVQELLFEKKYDAYMIFDADNSVSKNFFLEMEKVYRAGFDLGIGRRRTKNPKNAVAVGSGLIFTLLNSVANQNKSKYSLNCIASGTGYFVTDEVLRRAGGFPFHSLTEDYEISLYATTRNLKTHYEPRATFHDAQPEAFAEYFRQRTRWEKGYFEARQKYRGELISRLRFSNPNWASIYESIVGIYDLLLMVIGAVLMLVSFIIMNGWALLCIVWLLLGIYVALMILTGILLHLEKNRISLGLKIKAVFYGPLLFLTYVPCLFRIIFGKEVNWERTKH